MPNWVIIKVEYPLIKRGAQMSILKKVTMKDQIYALIKERIFNQTYKQGEKINMLELSQELGVSNSPIREALSQLESEGLIVFTPNAGPSVIAMNEAIFEEVQETARILLLGCYEQCVEKNLAEELIKEATGNLQKQKDVPDGSSEESEAEFARAAIDFDVSVIKVLGNKTLERLYAAFFNQLFLVVLYDHRHSYVDRKENIRQHQEILDAVKAGDPEEVRHCIYKHFDRHIEDHVK